MVRKQIKKNGRDKKFIGAIIGTVAGIASGLIGANKQRKAEDAAFAIKQGEQNRMDGLKAAQSMTSAYADQSYVDQYNKKITLKGGGKVAIKDKIRKFALGGNIGPKPKKPIITNNPKDPRIKKYNDSLTVYNKGLDLIKSTPTLVKDITPIDKITAKSLNTNFNIKSNILPIGQYRNDSGTPAFKKPTTPVVYKKPTPAPITPTIQGSPLEEVTITAKRPVKKLNASEEYYKGMSNKSQPTGRENMKYENTGVNGVKIGGQFKAGGRKKFEDGGDSEIDVSDSKIDVGSEVEAGIGGVGSLITNLLGKPRVPKTIKKSDGFSMNTSTAQITPTSYQLDANGNPINTVNPLVNSDQLNPIAPSIARMGTKKVIKKLNR